MQAITLFVQESGKLFRPKRLDTLILYVTSRCNAKCGFCFYGKELNSVSEMSLETIAQISRKLKSLRGLLIGGGEPFLRADLFEIISVFVKDCGIRQVQIPTNGFFTQRIVSFVDKVTKTFPGLDLSIQVSLDAVGEEHDAKRELKGCFRQAEETIAQLKALRDESRRFRVLVVSVLTPETVGGCRDLADYVRTNIQPDYHWFELVRAMPFMQERLKLSDETISFLEGNLKYYLKNIPGSSSSIYASRLFNRLLTEFSLGNFQAACQNFVHKKRWPAPCCAGERMAVLYPDGILAACELRGEQVPSGDYDYDIHRALREYAPFQMVRKDTRNHACDCTHGCFIPTSRRYSPAELFKTFWKAYVVRK
ncbi:MAG: radical SAM protein [Candidatus Omnitrophota bacterium]